MQKRVPKRIDRDLTQEEIDREMNRIRDQMEGKNSKKPNDMNIWQTPGTNSLPPQGGAANNMGWAKF